MSALIKMIAGCRLARLESSSKKGPRVSGVWHRTPCKLFTLPKDNDRPGLATVLACCIMLKICRRRMASSARCSLTFFPSNF